MAEKLVLYFGTESREVAAMLKRRDAMTSVDLRAWNRLDYAQAARFVFELTVPKERASVLREEKETGAKEYRVEAYEAAWLWKAPPDDPLASGPR